MHGTTCILMWMFHTALSVAIYNNYIAIASCITHAALSHLASPKGQPLISMTAMYWYTALSLLLFFITQSFHHTVALHFIKL